MYCLVTFHGGAEARASEKYRVGTGGAKLVVKSYFAISLAVSPVTITSIVSRVVVAQAMWSIAPQADCRLGLSFIGNVHSLTHAGHHCHFRRPLCVRQFIALEVVAYVLQVKR